VAVLIRGLDRAGVEVGTVSVSRPSLDDVFLAATGGRMASRAEEPQPDGDGGRRSQ
jgi:hypothetical protein